MATGSHRSGVFTYGYFCAILTLEVADLAKALPVLRRVLIAQGAPPGTTIRQYRPSEIVYDLHEEG